jgi:4-hydroxy-tetrahydrodipicolinate synthase
VTPFRDDGSVDEAALRALVEWQIQEGVDFLVPAGSTGEAATLAPEEQVRVVAVTAEQARSRVPVVAGAGSNDTAKAVRMSRAVTEAGATHLLHVSPMYNKPPQRGLVAHFTAIADAVERPVVLYNVPGRTASNMEAATTLRLAEHANVVAVKEASGNLAQMEEILRNRPDGFAVLSGDDALTLTLVSMGGDGVISVVSNATPRAMADLTRAALDGNLERAGELHHRLTPWMSAAFVESNPIPVKAALAAMGRIRNVLRLPLVPLADQHRSTVTSALRQAGVEIA